MFLYKSLILADKKNKIFNSLFHMIYWHLKVPPPPLANIKEDMLTSIEFLVFLFIHLSLKVNKIYGFCINFLLSSYIYFHGLDTAYS